MARQVGYNPKNASRFGYSSRGSWRDAGHSPAVQVARWGGSRRPSLRSRGQSTDASPSPSVPLPRGEREEGWRTPDQRIDDLVAVRHFKDVVLLPDGRWGVGRRAGFGRLTGCVPFLRTIENYAGVGAGVKPLAPAVISADYGSLVRSAFQFSRGDALESGAGGRRDGRAGAPSPCPAV
jgi:hypothetical protein